MKIDSTYAYAYSEKSVAYLKSGDFVSWKLLIDKAVELDPKSYLGSRAWCRFSWFRDYKGAIEDIEALDELTKYNIGYSDSGEYHLQVVRAMSYGSLGNHEKGITVLLTHMRSEDFLKFGESTFDYWCLGLLYYKNGEFELAIKAFNKQNEVSPFMENSYYLALALKNKDSTLYSKTISKAYEQYLNNIRLWGPYVNKWGTLDELIEFNQFERKKTYIKE